MRSTCLVGLALTWIAGLAALVAGAFAQRRTVDIQELQIPIAGRTRAHLLPLAINIIITGMVDATGLTTQCL